MKRRLLSLFTAVCITAGLFSGCVSSSAKKDSDSKASDSSAADSSEAAGTSGGAAASEDSEEPDSSAEDTAADVGTAAGGEDITLTIWDWDEAHLSHMTALYNELNPNVSFETLIVTATDYMQKLQSALASGMDVPDVILGELLYRGRLFEMGILEDLSQDPYNVNPDDMFEFAVQLETGPAGELLGVEQQICPSGFAFRRDLAKEYLGTDDPDELAELIPTWDKFIELGKTVAEKSGGDVTIYPGISVMMYDTLNKQNPSPYIEGDKINLTERYTEMFELGVEMNQAGILGNQERETPALNSAFAEGSFIFFPCPPWALKWNVEVNDPDGTGNWGLTKAPEGGFTRGGTSVSIYSDSPNKDAAWEYIQYTYCDGDGVREAYEQFGFMTGFKAPYEDENSYFFTTPGAYDEYFGGQNLAEYFINDISLNTKGQVQTKHESSVTNALLAVVAQMANDKDMTADEAIELLKQETQTIIPEAEIE